MRKAGIKAGEFYAVPCEKAGCVGIHKGTGLNDPARMLHRARVLDNDHPGVEVEVDPGLERVVGCTCPTCGSWHAATRPTTEPEQMRLRPTDIACPWDQRETWMATRGWRRRDVSFGDIGAELDKIMDEL